MAHLPLLDPDFAEISQLNNSSEGMSAIEGSVNTAYETDGQADTDHNSGNHSNSSDHQYVMTMCTPDEIEVHCRTGYAVQGDMESSDGKDQELQHASNMSASSPPSMRSSHSSKSLTSSAYRVEIGDIDDAESLNLTTTHLKRCKRQVLRPYWRLLMFIGWRGFGREYVNSSHVGWKVLNTLYPLFIVLLLFYTYCYEIVACQWKLNVEVDTQLVGTTLKTTTHKPSNVTTTTPSFVPFITMEPAHVDVPSKNLSLGGTEYPLACQHIVTTYVVPNVLHFVAFMMGLIHFRVQENEHLYALMENVFLQASPLHSRSASQNKLIKHMRCFFLFGAVWMACTLGMQALYEWAFDFPKLALFIKTGPVLHWFLFAIELYGILVVNSIFIAVVTNYYTQCEMILFYVKGIVFKLQEKSIDLKTAMKNVLSVRHNLSILNGPIARMTALVSVIFAELVIIGTSILVLNKNNQYKVWMYRAIYPAVWFVILALPLMQAARVNSVCNRFKKIALETRVFGYKGSSLLELDSFLNFIGHARLRAKMFHIPILPSYIISLVVLALFVLLILLQTSVIGTDHFF